MAITVPKDGDIISAGTFGIPVANEVNRMTPIATVTPWADLALQNGYANEAGFQKAQYRKIGDVVYLRGSITVATTNTAYVFTLPAGFRPIVGQRFFGGGFRTGTGGVYTWRGDIDIAGGFAIAEWSLTPAFPATFSIPLNFSTI